MDGSAQGAVEHLQCAKCRAKQTKDTRTYTLSPQKGIPRSPFHRCKRLKEIHMTSKWWDQKPKIDLLDSKTHSHVHCALRVQTDKRSRECIPKHYFS